MPRVLCQNGAAALPGLIVSWGSGRPASAAPEPLLIISFKEVHMTKNTDTISIQGAVSAGENAAVSAASLLNPSQYDTSGKERTLTLRSAFPQYREVTEVLQEIAKSQELADTFRSLAPSRRQEFLDFCCGNRGIRVLYDSFFKYVFNPDVQASALSRMISVLIGLDVKLVQILPNESHLGADYTLVIMDIIVEASDGSIVNVEVQKIGYNFPGERAACYNADLLLRQYQRIRKEFSENDRPENGRNRDGEKEGDIREARERKSPKFSYKYIRPVYTIVLMETSTKDFHEFRQDYIHTFTPTSDTGLKLNLLQNYIFVPLDIFQNHLDALLSPSGRQTMTEKEAWLAFLSSDDPRVIMRILEQFPDIFRPLYDRICTMCQNTKEMMHMFSEELSILDKNTVMMMIEEQQETIEQQKQELTQQKQELSQQKQALSQQKQELSQKDETIGQQKQEIKRLLKELEEARRK